MHAVMNMPFGIHAGAQADPAQQIDRTGLQHTGADTRQHMRLGPAFQHDRVDARVIQKMREQQSRRPATDDGDLRLHVAALRAPDMTAPFRPGESRSLNPECQ